MTLPRNRVVLEDRRKQIELFVKQRLVIGEIIAEQRKVGAAETASSVENR